MDAWHAELTRKDIAGTYGAKLTAPEDQPWRIRNFVLTDPSGVLWRIGQNLS